MPLPVPQPKTVHYLLPLPLHVSRMAAHMNVFFAVTTNELLLLPLACWAWPQASSLLSCASSVLSCASCLLPVSLLPVTSSLMPLSYCPGLERRATCLLHFALPVPRAFCLWPKASWMSPCNSCVVCLGSMAYPLLRLD